MKLSDFENLIKKITDNKFTTQINGYNASEVDAFIDLITKEIYKFLTNHLEQEKKIKDLEQKINSKTISLFSCQEKLTVFEGIKNEQQKKQ
ncbi:DivIVA domain-containing protein [Mycoplasmopsis pulmonis]|nr:DivIVA domain-containing protein [Mycoplasmopsis pulmonis]MDZ7293265.1 DivIVA domain-containing protein [Mycoplasmopsis pulmonis]VEU68068.1 cell division protein GpsB [Mycoplasmopsis pulmonis]